MVVGITSLLVAGTVIGVGAQRIGLGPPQDTSFEIANRNPLNKTSHTFRGFNFSADPAIPLSNYTPSNEQWTFNAGLSIIDTESNRTNYPISAAANETTNVIDVAYTLDFPGGQFPQQNYTNWTVCANVVRIPWTSDVLERASRDPGDCSVVFGASCLSRIQLDWRSGSISSIGCRSGPDLQELPECKGITTNGYGYYTSSVMSFYSDLNNRSSAQVGLKSGQIFSYESTASFNASQAQANYDENAGRLRMVVLTFSPSQAFFANHTGNYNPGEARTFCTILNPSKAQSSPTPNAASKPSMFSTVAAMIAVWTVLFTWEMV